MALARIYEEMITQDIRAYRDALPNAGVLIGLDLGTKTIGTAFCDAGWSFATPSDRIRRSKFATQGPRSQSTQAFARNIEDIGLPILLWDERWSTQAVERDMIAADMSRSKRADKIDSGAAAFILQGAIDALVA